MTLQVPITLTGNNINVTVPVPMAPLIPAIPLGTWVTPAEYFTMANFAPEITDNSGDTIFYVPESISVFHFRIAPEHLTSFTSSSPNVYITGDLQNHSAQVTSQGDGLYRIQVFALKPKDGVATPKIRIIVYNSTESYLVSPDIYLQTLNEDAPVTDILGQVITTDNPLQIPDDGEYHIVDIKSNGVIASWYKGATSYQGVVPYDYKVVSITIEPSVYIYRVAFKYQNTLGYGELVPLRVNWSASPSTLGTAIETIAVKATTAYNLSLDSSWIYNGFTTDTGVVYDHATIDPEAPLAYDVNATYDTVRELPLAILTQKPTYIPFNVPANKVLIPLFSNYDVKSLVRNVSDGVLKNDVAMRYETYDANDTLILNRSLSWLDCLAFCSNSTNSLLVEIEGVIPEKIIFYAKFGQEEEVPYPIGLAVDIYGVELQNLEQFNFTYTLYPSLSNDPTPVTFTLGSESHTDVFSTLKVDPSATLLFDPAEASSLSVTLRSPTIQEILDAIN